MRYPLIKPRFYGNLFQEILQFIRTPTLEITHDKTVRQKIYGTIGLFILKFLFLIPVVLFFALVYDPENVQNVKMTDRLSPFVFLLVGAFILPFLEEVAFRLSLRFKPIYLTVSSVVLSYYILTKLVFQSSMSLIDDSFVVRVLASLFVGLIVFFIVNEATVKERLTRFWASYFRWIYYTICLLFAWVHITKYELSWKHLLLLPILTLPQLFSALIYGYIRVSFGFQYPLFFHMTNNLLAIGLSFLPFTDILN